MRHHKVQLQPLSMLRQGLETLLDEVLCTFSHRNCSLSISQLPAGQALAKRLATGVSNASFEISQPPLCEKGTHEFCTSALRGGSFETRSERRLPVQPNRPQPGGGRSRRSRAPAGAPTGLPRRKSSQTEPFSILLGPQRF